MRIKATELRESTFFPASILPSQHFTVKMPIEIHYFNFEIGTGRNFPVFFLKSKRGRILGGDEVKKKRRKGTRDTVSISWRCQ